MPKTSTGKPYRERPLRKARSRAEELQLLRRAHAAHSRLEVATRIAREMVRAIDWRLVRASRRIAVIPVSPEESASHRKAARRIGVTQRELLVLLEARRTVRREIVVRTRRMHLWKRP